MSHPALPIDPNNPNTLPDTQPQNQPPAPEQPTNNGPDLATFYAQNWQVQREENARLQRELEDARNRQPAPPQRDYSDRDPTFLERPASNVAEIVRREVAETIAPIQASFQEFLNSQKSEGAYTKLKNQYRNTIQHFDKIESLVDQIMQGATPDANTFMAAVRMAFGELSMRGQSPFNAPPPPINTTVPAQLPPSPPPAPASNFQPGNGSPARLTEFENRMARERNMTAEEYMYWRDLPPEKVATSKGWDRTNNKPAE